MRTFTVICQSIIGVTLNVYVSASTVENQDIVPLVTVISDDSKVPKGSDNWATTGIGEILVTRAEVLDKDILGFIESTVKDDMIKGSESVHHWSVTIKEQLLWNPSLISLSVKVLFHGKTKFEEVVQSQERSSVQVFVVAKV